MKNVSYRDVSITGGFWKEKQDLNAGVTAQQVYDRFAETYRFDALNCRPEGEREYTPHVYWDSDVAKWIEGVAYILDKGQGKTLYPLAREAIHNVLKNQTPEGYFNSHFQVVEPENRYTDRNCHELYCAGHLMEAAVAWFYVTGEKDFLDAMCRYADYIYDVFVVQQWPNFVTPGHEEIELALVRLYEATNNEKYRDLAWFFLSQRGSNEKDRPVAQWCDVAYQQDQLPLAEQRTAEGHCVRAMYIYSAMADAVARGETQYQEACDAVFEDVLAHKLYITGGIGSNKLGESFATPYYLPNDEAYTETCAAISLAMFAQRLQKLKTDSRYGDIVERVIYNGMLSGLGLDGKTFFYTNPLEIDPEFYAVNPSTITKRWRPVMQRPEVFRCSCCPPNVVRFLASLGDYVYGVEGDTVYVHQFMESQAGVDGCKVTQTTNYPLDGAVTVRAEGKRIAVRIPGWCQSFTASKPYELKNGYAHFAHGEVTVTFDMPVTLVEADTRVQNNAGRVAVTRGPVVYCLEAVDNGKGLRSVRIDHAASFAVGECDRFGLPVLTVMGEKKKQGQGLYQVYCPDYEEKKLTFIPYYGFANRGISELLVWVAVK